MSRAAQRASHHKLTNQTLRTGARSPIVRARGPHGKGPRTPSSAWKFYCKLACEDDPSPPPQRPGSGDVLLDCWTLLDWQSPAEVDAIDQQVCARLAVLSGVPDPIDAIMV